MIIKQKTPQRGAREKSEALEAFKKTHPGYLKTFVLDSLRASEYARLDAQGQVYLDYTGASLYAESQIQRHADMLSKGVFGNTHSINPTSSTSTRLLEEARSHILKFFNGSPDEYVVIFTSNAT